MSVRVGLVAVALGSVLAGGAVAVHVTDGDRAPGPQPVNAIADVTTLLETTDMDPRAVEPIDDVEPVDWADLEPGDTVTAEDYFAATGTPVVAKAKTPRQVKGNRIVVPALNAALPVLKSPVKNGVMDVPPGVSHVGWLASSRSPNARRGVTVLASHRDTGGGGRGVHSALYDAEKLKRGAKVKIRWKGKTTVYRVSKISWHDANRLPLRIMKRTGKHKVVLLTCGGDLRMGSDGRLRWSKRALVWVKQDR